MRLSASDTRALQVVNVISTFLAAVSLIILLVLISNSPDQHHGWTIISAIAFGGSFAITLITRMHLRQNSED